MSDLDFLTDRVGVEDLSARYAHSADSYDADGRVNCFAQDGIFEVKADGDWKIKHRIVHRDNTANLADGELAVYLQLLVVWMAENGTLV